MKVFILFYNKVYNDNYQDTIFTGVFSSYDNAFKYLTNTVNLNEFEQIDDTCWVYEYYYFQIEEKQIDELLSIT